MPEPSVGTAELKKLQCLFAYLYFEQQGNLSEHVFYELFVHSDPQSEYRLLAEAFFKELFGDDRLFLTYFNFDLQPTRINLVRDIIAKCAKQPDRLILQALINNVYAQNLKLFPDAEFDFVREQNDIVSAFNGSTEKGCELLRKKFPEEGRE